MKQQRATKWEVQISTPLAGGVLQRKCASCGNHTIGGGVCEASSKKREGMLQFKTASSSEMNEVPPIVHEALRSTGRPLDAATRAFMEPRFGYDFSRVRVHSDVRAADSARAVNALAYTVGQDVVFGAGQYAPGTNEGRKLLAHELTHVAQQGSGIFSEQEADLVADSISVSISRGHVSWELMGAPVHARSVKFTPQTKSRTLTLQRKMALSSDKEAKAFKWFLTPGDAANFEYAGQKGKPLGVKMKSPASATFEDAFRVNILKTIISHPSETLLIREFGLDEKVTPHLLFEEGKISKTGVKPTLREMAQTVLGAGGVTIPSQSLALVSDANYSGPVTGVTNESWIFYSKPTDLAHEFGHAILLFSGTSWGHGGQIPKSAGVVAPGGTPFEGEVNVFISKFVAEQYAELDIFDPDALHFSPTVVRNWPEPPDYKLTFKGTWLQFLAKYPGSKVSQEVKEKGGKKSRKLKVCVPRRGQICP